MLKLSAKELAEEDNNRISQLMLTIGDFERIGDHANYMLQIAEKLKDSDKKLSAEAVEELKVIVHAVSEIFMVSFDAYKNDNVELAKEVEALEAVIKRIIRKVKNRHIQRLQDGLCTPDLSFLFSDISISTSAFVVGSDILAKISSFNVDIFSFFRLRLMGCLWYLLLTGGDVAPRIIFGHHRLIKENDNEHHQAQW